MTEVKENKYTYDYCKNIASQCRNRTQMNKINYTAYYTSCQNKWIDDFFPSSVKLTYEKCKEIAEKYNNDITNLEIISRKELLERNKKQKGY